MLVVLAKILALGQVGHQSSLDRLHLGQALDGVDGLSHGEHGEVVCSHHAELPFEASGHDRAENDRGDLVVVPEADVQVLLDLLDLLRVGDFDKALILRQGVVLILLVEDHRVPVLVAYWATSTNAAGGVLEAPLLGGIQLPVLVQVGLLVEHKLGVIDLSAQDELVDEVRLEAPHSAVRLYFVLVHLVHHCLALLGME